jgi:putative phage-type endonuclease
MNMTKEERQKILGASDVGVALGLSNYKTPHDLYLEKTRGIYQPVTPEIEEKAYWGHKLEPVIADEFLKRNPELKYITSEPMQFRHHEHEHMIVHPDRCLLGLNGYVEIKTCGFMMRDKFGDTDSDIIPDTYLAQVQYGMHIMRHSYCYIPVLIGGQEYRQYKIMRNDDFIQNMMILLHNFWDNHVLADVPPPAQTMDDVKSKFAIIQDESRLATNDEIKLVMKVKELSEQRLKLQKEEKRLKVNLADSLGSNQGLKLVDDEQLVYYSETKSGARRFKFY